MKSKQPTSNKKQSITVKDLKTRKNPKGGGLFLKIGDIKGESTKFFRPNPKGDGTTE